MAKTRLDKLIFERGITESREKAQSLIMANLVLVNGLPSDKPGTLTDEDAEITLKETLRYVSRGGLKLEKALTAFHLNFEKKTVLDIGASTGGFTDLALQNGAEKVFAVDVGKSQLHEKLKNCSNVINLEKTNFRYIEFEKIGEYVDMIVSDVSFISLKLIIPKMVLFSNKNTEACLLIKPQFEAGKKFVGKNGVVRDLLVHEAVIKDISDFAVKFMFFCFGLTKSPVKGAKGNVEYLIYLKYGNPSCPSLDVDTIKKVVYEEYSYHC